MIIRAIRRKAILDAGIKEADFVHLFQRAGYFSRRKGDVRIYLEFDVLMIFVGLALLEFFQMRNVSGFITELAKHHSNLFGLLKQNSRQFLRVEKVTEEVLGEPMSEYKPFIVPTDSLKSLDMREYEAVVLINLEPIYRRVEELFEREGTIIATDGEGK